MPENIVYERAGIRILEEPDMADDEIIVQIANEIGYTQYNMTLKDGSLDVERARQSPELQAALSSLHSIQTAIKDWLYPEE